LSSTFLYVNSHTAAGQTGNAPKGKTVAVVLDPDVASVFQSSESVNSLLRSVISALPQSRG